jgi:hypothetical protein
MIFSDAEFFHMGFGAVFDGEYLRRARFALNSATVIFA